MKNQNEMARPSVRSVPAATRLCTECRLAIDGGEWYYEIGKNVICAHCLTTVARRAFFPYRRRDEAVQR